MATNLSLEEFRAKVFDETTSTEWKFKGTRPAVIDFYADWCGPCKAVAPIIEKLSKQYDGQIDIYKVDTEEEPQLSQMFGISSIPSLLFIPVDGQPSMARGAMPEAGFHQAFDELFGIKKP
jgi:thioredoxin 1